MKKTMELWDTNRKALDEFIEATEHQKLIDITEKKYKRIMGS